MGDEGSIYTIDNQMQNLNDGIKLLKQFKSKPVNVFFSNDESLFVLDEKQNVIILFYKNIIQVKVFIFLNSFGDMMANGK
jgi:hypothetical protein